MSIRIAVAGVQHETNTFAPWPTDIADFQADGWFAGDALLGLAGTNTVIGGVVDAAAAMPGIELLPIFATRAIPGGLVTANAFDLIADLIVAGIVASSPDAIVLDLHGAMVSEDEDDGDGAILRLVRGAVGTAIPIVAVLDLHANVSQEMADLADALVPYDTYPHVDNAARGAEALSLAAAASSGDIRLSSALVKIPLMPPGPKQFSGVEPTVSIMAKAVDLETRPGVLNVGVTFAFPYADCPFAGMGVLVSTNGDQRLASDTAHELADFIWQRRESFRPEVATVEAAVHAAMSEPTGPVVLADLGDNPGGGSACDGTALLWALLDLGAHDAAVAVIVDQATVQRAVEAGIGASIDVDLGGKTDDLHGHPVPVSAVVQSTSDGAFIYEGPMDTGRRDSLGTTAVLRCTGRHGNVVEVIVCERRVQALDLAIFRSQGIEPTERKILVVKSAVHFRGAFGPIASRIIEVGTPGLTSVEFQRFPYSRLPRPIWPLDPI